MVNVAHYGHNRCTGERLAFELQGLGQGIFQGVVAYQSHFVAQFFSNQLSSFLIKYLVDGRRSSQLEHELDDFSSLDRHLCSQIADSDGLANLHVTNYRAGWALETVSVTLLELALATTTATEAIAFFIGRARSNTWSRCFFFNRCAMRCVLAIAVTTAATIVIVSAWFVRATLFITFACISGRRWCCSHCCLHRCRCRDSRSCCWSRCRCRLTARVFFGATLGFFISLLTCGIFYCTTLIHLTLALGFDFFRAALYENFLLAYFNTNAFAASYTQGTGGFTLQSDLARFFHFSLVAAFQVSQQSLLLTVGHILLGGVVRQTCLTHLLQQALNRCFDLIGQLFHRDLRHAFLSSGRA